MASTLPLDLERHIFELAARSRPVSIPMLVRVAWRVKHWVEPLLYRTLVINEDPINGFPRCDMDIFARVVRDKPDDFLHAVRNVIISADRVDEVIAVVHACPRIENLYLKCHSRPFHSLPEIPLPLRHLYCNSSFYVPATAPLGVSPISVHLTHLELFEAHDFPGGDVACWSALGALPHLTHLALGMHGDPRIYLLIMGSCKVLSALLILENYCHPRDPVAKIFAEDMRCVLVEVPDYDADWQWGALVGRDYWARADELIAKRISGEIDCAYYPLRFVGPSDAVFLQLERSF